MNDAFLTRLSHIVETAPDALQSAEAITLVDAYRHSLYGRLGIVSSCRPTKRAKEEAKEALDDLRHKVLRAEVAAPAGSARIYLAVRQRIEMARRSIDLCIADDGGGNAGNVQPAIGPLRATTPTSSPPCAVDLLS